MNTIIKNWKCIIALCALIALNACKGEEDEFDKSPAPAAVIAPSFVSTNGGAIINFTLPEDENLLFVKAVYTNSLGNEVFRSTSRYSNQIEIDGFVDLNPHEVLLYAVGNNGKTSSPVPITVKPDTSYIYLIQKNLEVREILGGVNIKWKNTSEKTVFVYVDYDDKVNGAKQRILSSGLENFDYNIRGMASIPYNVSVTIEDFSGNKTSIADKGTFTPDPEQKIEKSTWEFLQNLSCNGEKYEGSMKLFFDDVIDVIELGGKTKDDPENGNNSYFLIHKDDNSDPLQFLDGGTGDKPLLIVIDMHKQIVLNRIVVWQRAFDYDAGNPNSTQNNNYHYYKEDNLRSFYFYGANEHEIRGATKQSLAQLAWKNPLMICDIGDPRDATGAVPSDKIQEAIDGHEFELPNLSEPFRYIVIGITQTYGSATQINASEISLYGMDNVIPDENNDNE
jgi:hypothetical protein